MSREWKPGDVALVTEYDRPLVALVGMRKGSTLPMFFYADGGFDVAGRIDIGDDEELNIAARPLVVIDPEDREAVGWLRALYHEQRSTLNDNDATGDMQAALREFADPKPPKPYTTHTGNVAPWPVVNECHSSHAPGHECPQCAWSHRHKWVEWTSFPTGPGKPVRCTKCGGRKCDQDACALQRHHGGDHEGVQL